MSSVSFTSSNTKPWVHGKIKQEPSELIGNLLNGIFLLVHSLNLFHKFQPAVYVLRPFPSGYIQYGVMYVSNFFYNCISNIPQNNLNRLSNPRKIIGGKQIKNIKSDQETVEPLFHLNKVILIRRPQRFASTRISN